MLNRLFSSPLVFFQRKNKKAPYFSYNSYSPKQLIVGCSQSIGRHRDKNEDAIFTLSSIISDGLQKIPYGLFIVADGMGGHQKGELASSIAIRSIASYIVPRLINTIMNYSIKRNDEKFKSLLLKSIQKAQLLIREQVLGGGTTLTAALVVSDSVMIAHVGDSRAYLFYPEGELTLLTRDHSLVQQLIDNGSLSEEKSFDHPQKNVLYRALGQDGQLKVDYYHYPFPEGAVYMLCSDGLWGVVNQKDILRILAMTDKRNPAEACHLLVQAANANGGPDNISVIIFTN